MKRHSQDRPSRPYRARGSEGPDAVSSDDRKAARANLEQNGSPHSALLLSRPDVSSTATEADHANAFWWSAFAFIAQGFAAYGVSQHPTAASIEWALNTNKGIEPLSPACALTVTESRHHIYPQFENSNVEPGRIAAPDVGRRGHWNWLTSTLETVVVHWTHWRQEREIRRAVAALAKFDDRTLRDMGISQRSQIDQAVRYCRDC